MAKAIAFLVLLLVSPAVYAVTQHTVGDASGWTTNIHASNWGSGQTFSVGDTLVFNYGSTHAVDVVSSDDYRNCNSANPIDSYSTSPTTITLNATGAWYFICPRSTHCSIGQRLTVNVTGVGTTPPGASVPATPGTPPVRAAPSAAGNLGRGGLVSLVLIIGVVGLIG